MITFCVGSLCGVLLMAVVAVIGYVVWVIGWVKEAYPGR